MSTLHHTSHPPALRRALRTLAWEWYSIEWSADFTQAVCFFCRQPYTMHWSRWDDACSAKDCTHSETCVVTQCRRALHPEEERV